MWCCNKKIKQFGQLWYDSLQCNEYFSSSTKSIDLIPTACYDKVKYRMHEYLKQLLNLNNGQVKKRDVVVQELKVCVINLFFMF